MAADQEHDVAVRLLALLKEALLYHLRVVDEADELPLAQVDDALRHVHGHVHDRDFLVHRSPVLVRQERVVDHPRLGHWLLRVVTLLARVFRS